LQRIQPYLFLTDGGVFELTQLEETSPWTETVDALTTAEHVLSKMMEAIAGDNAAPNPTGYDDIDDNESVYSRESGSVETQEEAPNQVNNIRIRSMRFVRDEETQDEKILGLGGTGLGDKEDHHEDSILLHGGLDLPTMGVDFEDHNIPSRVSVKKSSVRTSMEAKRKEEMAIRRKR
jgi:hypothetical protein